MNSNKARREAINKAKDLLAKDPIFLDTETTGTDERAEIVEISILDRQGQILLDTLVKPSRKIPRSAMAVHHITNTMVKKAPAWPEIWPEVKRILENRHVGIYNAEFDLRLIRQTHDQAGLPWEDLGARAVCIMKLYAQFYGDWNPSKADYTWQRLENARIQCGLSLTNSHRARDDTLLTRAVLYHMAQTRPPDPELGWSQNSF